MTSAKAPWFVIDRSEALAGLLLTARKDIEVRSKKNRDDGVSFLVAVNEGEAQATRLFVVEVKGTTSEEGDWMQGVQQLYRSRSSPIYLPMCVVVVNVRDNRAVYAWVAEPSVEAGAAKLRFLPPPSAGDFRALSPAAVDEIVDRVKAWYEVLTRQLVPTPT